MLTLKLLGLPALYLHENPVTLKTNKSQALFYYLVMNPDFHSRDLLADLLWPHMNTQQARKNLRDALSHLNGQIGNYLLVDRQKLAFDRSLPYQSDLHRTLTQIEQGRATADLPQVEQGLSHYQEKFLEGLRLLDATPFEQWVSNQREIHHRRHIETMTWLAFAYYERQQYHEGITTARRLLTLEPWQENIHRLLMQLLLLDQQPVAAIRQYEICRQQLAKTMGILPSVETERLYAQIKAGGNQEATVAAPPIATPPVTTHTSPPIPTPCLRHKQTSVPHNLPHTLTSLIGRTAEIAELRRLLLDGTYPLLTIVGEGGIGKTRIVLEVAQSLLSPATSVADPDQADHAEHEPAQLTAGAVPTLAPFPDGIWFVDLTHIDPTALTPSQIGDVILRTIGETFAYDFGGRRHLGHQLATYLRDKQLLLILDNFERLHTGAEVLVALLESVHQLQIMVTSRRRLNLSMAYLFHVRGLALPPTPVKPRHTPPTLGHLPSAFPSEQDAPCATAALLAFPAIQFFITCVQRNHPDFQLDAHNRDAIVRICRLLNGSPLGIQLAAQLVDLDSCEKVADQLAHDYQLLRTTQATLPAHQRTMRTVLDASWHLLTPAEATILAQCSLFCAPFDIDVLQAVTGATTAQVRQLVHCSFLQQSSDHQRFSLHELVRQYATTQLLAQPAAQADVQQRHAEYFIGLLAAHERSMQQDHQQLQLLKMQWEDIEAAWRWSIGAERLDLLAQGVCAMINFYHLSGLFLDAEKIFSQAITMTRRQLAATEPAGQRLLAYLLCGLNDSLRACGGIQLVEATANEVLSVGQLLGDAALQAIALRDLAYASQMSGDYELMLAYANRAVACLATVNEPWLQASALIAATTAALLSGQHAVCNQHGFAALACLGDTLDTNLVIRIHIYLGINAHRHKNYMQAHVYLTTALTKSELTANERTEAIAAQHLAYLLTELGDYPQAHALYVRAEAIYQTYWEPFGESWLQVSYGRLLHFCGDRAGARAKYELALQHSDQFHLHHALCRGYLYMGQLLTELGDFGAATHCYQQLQALRSQIKPPSLGADLHAGRATLALAKGDLVAAAAQVALAQTELATSGIEAVEELFHTYHRCIQVLQLTNPTVARSLRKTAYTQVRSYAAGISDSHLRHSFLSNNGAVVALINGAAK